MVGGLARAAPEHRDHAAGRHGHLAGCIRPLATRRTLAAKVHAGRSVRNWGSGAGEFSGVLAPTGTRRDLDTDAGSLFAACMWRVPLDRERRAEESVPEFPTPVCHGWRIRVFLSRLSGAAGFLLWPYGLPATR